MAKRRRNFYIDDELYEEFKTYARIANVSLTEVIETSIAEFNHTMKHILSGMSAGELIDYSHYRLYKVAKEVNELPEGKDTRVKGVKVHL